MNLRLEEVWDFTMPRPGRAERASIDQQRHATRYKEIDRESNRTYRENSNVEPLVNGRVEILWLRGMADGVREA